LNWKTIPNTFIWSWSRVEDTWDCLELMTWCLEQDTIVYS